MFTASRLIVFVILVLGTAFAASAPEPDLEGLSRHPHFLRAYLFEKSLWGYRSAVTSPRFFFSPEGANNPLAEMKAANLAFSDTTKLYGTLKLPAACSFPARKKILESLLQKTFPNPPCPDLTDWIDRIAADQVSLVFVGAYAGNAASILGHSFFRFANKKRESEGRAGMDLLSQSAGFLAQTDPRDGRALYMLKGLSGGYPGYYDIEPYYMKVGLYNNAESRDLWDLPLNLTPLEVRLLIELMWEYSFNAEIPYYFIGRNCSYRLLSLLEIVRPETPVKKRLTDHFSFEVLPAETLRLLIDRGYTRDDQIFRASIERRLRAKKRRMSAAELKQFESAVESLEALDAVSEPQVMAAILDHWLFENYKVQTQLPPKQAELMEASYRRALELPPVLDEVSPTDAELARQDQLRAPFEGHRPRWVELDVMGTERDRRAGFSLRSGVHPTWSQDPGYRDISGIEYLGIDYQERQSHSAQRLAPLWKLLAVKAQSLEDFFEAERKTSWGFLLEAGNQCAFCETERAQLRVAGSYGVATRQGPWRISFLPDLMGLLTDQPKGLAAKLAPGVRSSIQWSSEAWSSSAWSASLESAAHFNGAHTVVSTELRGGYAVNTQRLVFFKLRQEYESQASVGLSWVQFF